MAVDVGRWAQNFEHKNEQLDLVGVGVGGFSVIWAPCTSPTVLLLFTRCCQSNNKYCTSQHESARLIIGKALEEEI